MLSFLSHKTLGIVAGSWTGESLTVKETVQMSPKMVLTFYIPPKMYVIQLLHTLVAVWNCQ